MRVAAAALHPELPQRSSHLRDSMNTSQTLRFPTHQTRRPPPPQAPPILPTPILRHQPPVSLDAENTRSSCSVRP